MTQRDIIQEIKRLKNELRLHFDADKLKALYDWIDRLEVPQSPMATTKKRARDVPFPQAKPDDYDDIRLSTRK